MNETEIEEKKIHFESLAPIDDVNISTYKEALDTAFGDSSVKNIAVTGPYSSGKTSILMSYLKLRENQGQRIKSINVSLAHFHPGKMLEGNGAKKGGGTDSDLDEDKYPVEGKIINQIIHQINPKKIPLSLFRPKHIISKIGIAFWSIIVFLATISVLLIIFKENIESYATEITISGFSKVFYSFLYIKAWAFPIVLSVCIFILVFKLVKFVSQNQSIRKLKIKAAEVELFSKDDGHTIFDKYLDEIVYLIWQSKCEIVIFEDLDRFDTLDVFERLREINLILNNSYKTKNRDTIKFVYLIRDSLLDAKDRTKFFDFIIPVIPVIDSSNSYSKFLEFIKAYTFNDKFDIRFLQELFLYVDDLRVMKEVLNEMMIYSSQIDMVNLDYNKLLSLVLYKVLFPQDFAELQFNRGYIFNVFANKPKLVENRIAEIDKELKTIKPLLFFVENEVFSSELQVAILFVLDEKVSISSSSLSSPSHFISHVSRSLSGADKETFNQKCEIIKKKNENIISKHNNLLREKEKLNSTPLKEILNRDSNLDYFNNLMAKNYNGDSKDNFESIKESEYYFLLIFLIRNGYIDESYQKYMTYFYEGGISRNDEKFLRGVLDQKGIEYSYPLQTPKEVISRLRPYYFDKKEVLNFSLFLELINGGRNNISYQEKIKSIIALIKRNSYNDFLIGFLNSIDEKKTAIEIINTEYPEFFYNVFDNKELKDFLHTYCIATICYCPDNVIEAMNIDNCLATFISEDEDFLFMEDSDSEKVGTRLEHLNVRFKKINMEKADKELLHQVYSRNLYELNFDNITMMESEFITSEYDFEHKNISLIYQKQDSPIGKYIVSSMNIYIDVVLGASNNEELSDTNDAAIWILNHEEINKQSKEKYLNRLKDGIITDLTNLTDFNLLDAIFSSDKAKCNEENIVFLYSNEGFSSTLINFLIKNNCNRLDFNKIFSEEYGGSIKSLFNDIVNYNEFADEKYESLICSFDLRIDGLNNNITENKLRILIKNKKLDVTNENLNVIRAANMDCFEDFILLDFSTYINLGSVPESEAIQILSSSKFSDSQKIDVLRSGGDYSISILGKDFSNELQAYIIENCPDNSDFNDLFSKYSHYCDESKSAILKQAKKLLTEENLSQYYDKINHDLVLDILQIQDISEQQKVSLCKAMILEKKNFSFIVECLCYFDNQFRNLESKNKTIRVKKNSINEILLNALQDSKQIKGFYLLKNGATYSVKNINKGM